jgi:hypothetical protein
LVFIKLWSHSYDWSIHNSKGLDERWDHENAGELRQVRWAAYLLIRACMHTSLREPHSRFHARKPSVFVSPFSLRAFLFGKAKRNADKYDECSYLMNGQVVIHDEDRASFYSSIKTTFNGCDCASFMRNRNLTGH